MEKGQSVTEQEEFEFRRRREQEREASDKGGGLGTSMAADALRGAGIALAEPITGLGELAPGALGRASARGSRYLEKEFDEAAERHPVATRAGYYPAAIGTAFVPAGAASKIGYLGKIGQAAEKLPAALRYAATGGAYGALKPTGKETLGERLEEKAPAVAMGATVAGAIPIAGGAIKSAIGVPTKTVEEIAREFEKRGYKLEPGQLRADKPFSSPGFGSARAANQKLANREASITTGQAAPAGGLSEKFLNKRLDDLGKEYDRIYSKQKSLILDKQAIDEMSDILNKEIQVVPGQVHPVTQATANLVKNYNALSAQMQQPLAGMKVPSDVLQRVLSELKRVARTSTDGNDRYIASKAISTIDNSVVRKHPEIAKELQALNKKYRASIALKELWDAGGIQGGNISLRKLGDRAEKLEGSDLYDLAVGGRELNMAARWEGSGAGEPGMETILSPRKLARALGTGLGLRSQAARGIQRTLRE